MKAYVGTSGWLYPWNDGGTLDWYLSNSGLNAIELNASFYRFPFPAQIKAWSRKAADLAWAVKVNRLITHNFKLSKRSYSTFAKFRRLFVPLESSIRFFLFQFPALLTPNMLDNVKAFVSKFDIGDKFALEVRNLKWFNEEVYDTLRKLGITMVSIDAPIGNYIVKTTKDVYLRIHGRRSWYDYYYSEKELADLSIQIKNLKPRNAYVFFNNDHAMLPNARTMLRLIK